MSIGVLDDGLSLSGERFTLVAGSVQYWRHERPLWGPILDNVCSMGFHAVEVYTPWNVHEVDRGLYDFGERDPKSDLPAFLDLCHERGLKVLIRPGPHINSELLNFGFPWRVLADPEVQASNAQGTRAVHHFALKPFPVPSYASPKLFDEFGLFLDALAPILRNRIYPDGPIVAIQADNELSFFFRLSAYDLDYSPAAIRQYHDFLCHRYGSVAELNRVYRSDYRSFDEVAPPRDFAGGCSQDLPYYLDWTRYKEHQMIQALRRITAMYRDRGLGNLPVFQNYPGPYTNVAGEIPYRSPFALAESEQHVDIVGVDCYVLKEDYTELKQTVQYAVGSSRLPFIPEFGSGTVPWRRTPLTDDTEFVTLGLLMHGIKAVSFYMIAERDRWIGSPITVNNRIRKADYDFYTRFNEMIREHSLLELRKDSEILMLANRDCERLASATALLPVPSRLLLNFGIPELYLSEDELGLGDAVPLDHFQLWQYLYAGLTQTGYTFDLSDTGALTEGRLERYRVVFVPSFSFMAKDSQEALRRFAEAGGTVVLGPRVPVNDDQFCDAGILSQLLQRPTGRLEAGILDCGASVRRADLFEAEPVLSADGQAAAYRVPVGRGAIIHFGFLPQPGAFDSAAQVVQLLLSASGKVCDPPSSNRQVEMVWHSRGTRRVLFACNPTDQRQVTTLTLPNPAGLRDLWSSDHHSAAQSHQLDIEPYTVKIWEVTI